MYEQTIIIGNVGSDPEMRFTANGKAVTNFSVAVNRRFKGKDGQMQEKTKWFRVTAWDKLGETCNQYLSKGRQVLVVGEVKASAYTNAAGEPAASLEIIARDVKFLGGKSNGNGGNAAPDPAGPTPDEDLPF